MKRTAAPVFSLILCTIDRCDEPLRFVKSLLAQRQASFELIVVDQNSDTALQEAMQPFERLLDIVYVRAEPGLSQARNIGLARARGSIIAFPDDDCEYPPGLLPRVERFLAQRGGVDGLTCRCVHNRPARVPRSSESVPLNRYNVWKRAVSFTIFLRRELVARVGGFDPNLGLGSGTPFGSGEETDYLLRALASGAHLVQLKDWAIFHPAVNYHARQAAQKARSYSRGLMYVMKRHRYPLAFMLAVMQWPLLRALTRLFERDRMRYHWNQFLGRAEMLTSVDTHWGPHP